MKITIITLMMTCAAVVASPLQIELHKPKPKDKGDSYESQIIREFNGLLESDKRVIKSFEPYLSHAKSKVGDRYMAALATPFSVKTSYGSIQEGRNQSASSNTTVIIYYSFSESSKHGSKVTSGVFAVFEVSGTYKYEGSILTKHNAVATFKGFHKQISAGQVAASDG